MTVLLHVDVLVESMDRSVEFYVRHFGCTVVDDCVVEGEVPSLYLGGRSGAVRVVFLKFRGPSFPGIAMLELIELRPSTPAPLLDAGARPDARTMSDLKKGTVVTLSLMTPSLDEKLESLRSAGVHVEAGPFELRLARLGTSRVAFVRDPDGTLLELVEAPPPKRARVDGE